MKKQILMFVSAALFFAGCTTIDGTGDVTEAEEYRARKIQPAAAAGNKSFQNQVSFSSDRAVQVEKSAAGSGFFQESDRMMAYTAGFTLVVKKRDTAIEEIKFLAEKKGGYLVSSARGNMRVKIPVKQADEFMKTAGNYGKLTDFRISAEDLTDTITDLNIRLDNLRKLRTRLTELLAKAKTVDEMLKVERELNRVTTEIERIDTMLQNNKNRVDFVTFDIAVVEEHGAIPGGNPPAIGKFRLVNDLCSSNAGAEEDVPFDIDVPDDFVVFGGGGLVNRFAAVSSDDCIFTVWKTDVADDSTLEFWQTIICRALKDIYLFDQIKTFSTEFDGIPAVRVTAQRVTADGIQKYTALLAVKRCLGDDELQIVEFFGPEKAFDKHEAAFSAALQK